MNTCQLLRVMLFIGKYKYIIPHVAVANGIVVVVCVKGSRTTEKKTSPINSQF